MKARNKFLAVKELLDFVVENNHSDFYRRKYKRADFDPRRDFKSIDDIRKIPLLAKEELMIKDPHKLLFVEKKEVDCVTTTSGTTGKPVIVFRSSRPKDEPNPLGMKVSCCLLLYRSHYPAISSVAEITLLGDRNNLPASLELADRLSVDTIITTPTLAIILSKYLKEYQSLKTSLKYISVGGETITSLKKKLLKSLFPGVQILGRYGISEAGGWIAFQCPQLTEKKEKILYHQANAEHYIFEIINPETLEKVRTGEEGELVITNLWNKATPIIRYRTGDRVIFYKNNCSCGAHGFLIEVLGRVKQDVVRVGGFELRSEMLEKPLINLGFYVKDEFEAHIYENFVENKPKIKIELNLSLKEGIADSPEIRWKIEQELLENWRLSPRLNLKKAVEAGLFEIPQINFVRLPQAAKPIRKLILH